MFSENVSLSAYFDKLNQFSERIAVVDHLDFSSDLLFGFAP